MLSLIMTWLAALVVVLIAAARDPAPDRKDHQ
jgi:hypothetical protein